MSLNALVERCPTCGALCYRNWPKRHSCEQVLAELADNVEQVADAAIPAVLDALDATDRPMTLAALDDGNTGAAVEARLEAEHFGACEWDEGDTRGSWWDS